MQFTSAWATLGVVHLGSALHLVGLALLIGGMLALGAFTAPVLFQKFARPEAGEAMTVIFRRYDHVILYATLAVGVGEALRLLALVYAGQTTFALAFTAGPLLRWAMVIALLLTLTYALTQINPKMEAMQHARQQGQSVDEPLFGKIHKQSESLYKLSMVIALLLLISFPCIQYPLSSHNPAAESTAPMALPPAPTP